MILKEGTTSSFKINSENFDYFYFKRAIGISSNINCMFVDMNISKHKCQSYYIPLSQINEILELFYI